MWPRLAEIACGVWLIVSPFILDYGGRFGILNLFDVVIGSAIVGIAILAMARWEQLHLFSIPLSLALVGIGYINPSVPAFSQNNILVGLTVLMFAVLPTRTTTPPKPWRPYVRGP